MFGLYIQLIRNQPVAQYRRPHVCFHHSHSAIHIFETTVKASGYLHGGHGEDKMSTVATFSIVTSSAVSFSVSFKLSSKRKKA